MRRTNRIVRITSATLVLAAYMGISFDAALGQAGSEVQVSIRYFAREGAFKGSIYNQERRRCEANRLLRIWKQKRVEDLQVGRDRTNSGSDYEVDYADARGRFYATAPRKTFLTAAGEERVCRRLRSVTIRVR
jgi:hypothetical protein